SRVAGQRGVTLQTRPPSAKPNAIVLQQPRASGRTCMVSPSIYGSAYQVCRSARPIRARRRRWPMWCACTGLRSTSGWPSTAVAWRQPPLDLLIFFRCDTGPCAQIFVPDPNNTSKKFGLDAQIDASGGRIALAVPVVYWIPATYSNIRGKWTVENLNKLIDEV